MNKRLILAFKAVYCALIVLAVALGIVLAFASITRAGSIYQRNKDKAHEAAELMRSYGYSEDNPIIVAAGLWWQEQDRLENQETEYVSKEQMKENQETEYVSKEQMKQYPVASYVWKYLKEAGFSDQCAAGILGNMMAECGGQSLELNPYISTCGYYGLCMWYIQYFPKVENKNIEGQLEVLLDTLEANMKMFGGDYDYFLALKDEKEASWYFGYYYERCVWSDARANNATKAIEYFG